MTCNLRKISLRKGRIWDLPQVDARLKSMRNTEITKIPSGKLILFRSHNHKLDVCWILASLGFLSNRLCSILAMLSPAENDGAACGRADLGFSAGGRSIIANIEGKTGNFKNPSDFLMINLFYLYKLASWQFWRLEFINSTIAENICYFFWFSPAESGISGIFRRCTLG